MIKNIKFAFFSFLVLSSYSFAMELDLDLSGNSNTKVTPKYTEAFENFVKGRSYKLICNVKNKASSYEYTMEHKTEVGYSQGPHGTTTHYKTERHPIKAYMDNWQCIYCRKHYNNYSNGSPPYITFSQKGNTRVMNIRESITTPPLCTSAFKDLGMGTSYYTLGGRGGWVQELGGMWKIARQLDLKSGYKPEDDITYTVTSTSDDCCTLF